MKLVNQLNLFYIERVRLTLTGTVQGTQECRVMNTLTLQSHSTIKATYFYYWITKSGY